MKTHSRVDRGRSHGEDLGDDTRGTTDGDGADESRALGKDREQMAQGDTDGPGGQGGAAVMRVQGEARVPED